MEGLTNSGSGSVEHIKVHGAALEGNLEADSPDRDVTVYLPPGYAADRSRRYPVVYLLHGYGGTDSTWTGRLASLPDIADRLVAAGRLNELIVVMPNAFSLHKGSSPALAALGLYRSTAGATVAVIQAEGLPTWLVELPSGTTHGLDASLTTVGIR